MIITIGVPTVKTFYEVNMMEIPLFFSISYPSRQINRKSHWTFTALKLSEVSCQTSNDFRRFSISCLNKRCDQHFVNAINFLFVDVLFINPHCRACLLNMYLGDDKQNASPNVPTGKTYSAICNKTHKQMHARLLFVMAMVNI